MGFRNIRQLAQEYVDNGRFLTTTFRKVPPHTTIASGGGWYDLSMASGNPVPNYYAASPLTASKLDSFRGIFHGDDKPSGSKFLKHMEMTVSVTCRGRFILLDYLLFYPFVDGNDLSEQTMVNTETLDRYEDGEGVMAMVICVAPTTGGGSFTMKYINQDGDAKTSQLAVCRPAALNIGSVATAASQSWMVPLADGDTGIRSITSFTMASVSGGLFSVVLVKPLSEMLTIVGGSTNECDYIRQKPFMPEIKNGAYLGLLCNSFTNLSASTIVGNMTTVWSET
jgi:hypothetical protein